MVERWPYEPEKRAKRLGLPDASEETFRAWAREGEPSRIPQVFLDAFPEEENKESEE